MSRARRRCSTRAASGYPTSFEFRVLSCHHTLKTQNSKLKTFMSLDLLYALDWAIISVSFFNTVAFLWLGLTVLLNAERRRWGTWAAGSALILAGLFFVGHSAVVGHDLLTFGPDIEFWWRVSWLPVVGAPYLWYLLTLWYTGVLRGERHRVWLAVVSVLGFAVLGMVIVACALSS